jgi:hypothetical protein
MGDAAPQSLFEGVSPLLLLLKDLPDLIELLNACSKFSLDGVPLSSKL